MHYETYKRIVQSEMTTMTEYYYYYYTFSHHWNKWGPAGFGVRGLCSNQKQAAISI